MSNISFLQKKPFRALMLMISVPAALGLFSAPSTLTTLILLGILGLTVFYSLLHRKEPVKKLCFSWGALILSLTFAGIGFLLFSSSMAYTNRMTRLAESLHISYLLNARLVAGTLGILGFYAFYRLAYWMEENLCRILSLPMQREGKLPLSNFLLPLSALGFFLLEPHWDPLLLSSAAAGTSMILAVSLHCPPILSRSMNLSGILNFLSFFTAMGIALFRVNQADLGIFGMAAGVLSLPFLYACLAALYDWMGSLFKRLGTFRDLKKGEVIFYIFLFAAAASFAAAVFLWTDAFYGTAHEFDVIYTADSPKLVKENCFLALRHHENDLRQPLFAVFAAPFTGLSYLVSCLLPAPRILKPLLLDWTQILLLLTANFLLARIMKFNAKNRILFMIITSLSYPVLLFTLMMEQYIVAYFWLIFTIYLIITQKRQAELPFCAAGGTLLTSLILMPALGNTHPVREFKSWFSQMLTLVLSFVLCLLCFGRLDIILDAPTQLLSMMQFSGQELTAMQKLCQYLGFFPQCLTAPAAAADFTAMGHPSWQLLIPTELSIWGMSILALSILSAVLNRKDPACVAAGLWLGFSFFVLFIMGWGTAENGLTLYTLYFGWAVWVLLWKLLQKLEEKLPHLTLIAGILLIFAEVLCNLPAIRELIAFAGTYYPI